MHSYKLPAFYDYTTIPELLFSSGYQYPACQKASIHHPIYHRCHICFASACNSRNVLSVALGTAINFIKPIHVADVLTAEAKEMHNGKNTGLYQVTITNQHQHIVALFKGTCFSTNKSLIHL